MLLVSFLKAMERMSARSILRHRASNSLNLKTYIGNKCEKKTIFPSVL